MRNDRCEINREKSLTFVKRGREGLPNQSLRKTGDRLGKGKGNFAKTRVEDQGSESNSSKKKGSAKRN